MLVNIGENMHNIRFSFESRGTMQIYLQGDSI